MKATLSYPISFSSVIVHRTQSTQTANAIHADGERNPCRRRTQSDWAADAIIRGYTCLKCTNIYQGVHLSQVYQQNMRCVPCYVGAMLLR